MGADEAALKHTTEYLVMERAARQTEEGGTSGPAMWIERETRFARSSRDAIASYVREHDADGGTFAAVPTRSFKQVTVATETQTRLTFR